MYRSDWPLLAIVLKYQVNLAITRLAVKDFLLYLDLFKIVLFLIEKNVCAFNDPLFTDLIIELLGKSSPDTLATLVLKSSSFRQFKSNKILSQIRENDIDNPVHALAFVILTVEQGYKTQLIEK